MTSESVTTPELDSVLQIALFDRKSRMFVLRLEQIVQCFARGSAPKLDIPGPLNSYFRLIAHKIAEYYAVGHVSSQDGTTVTLFLDNGPISQLPKPLCDFGGDSEQGEPPEEKRPPRRAMLLKKKKDAADADEPTNDMTNDTNNDDNDTNTNQLSSDKAANLSSSSSPSLSAGSTVSSQAPKGRGSLEARNAAYEEARARIFSTPAAREEAEEDKIEEHYSRQEQSARHDADYSRQIRSAPPQLPPYSAPPVYYYPPQHFQGPPMMPPQQPPYHYPMYHPYYPNPPPFPMNSPYPPMNPMNPPINSAPNSNGVTPEQSQYPSPHASRSSTPSYRRNRH